MSDEQRAMDGRGAEYDAYGAGGGERAPTPVATAMRLLRGRWAWAFGLGGSLAAVGATLGWILPTKEYQSVGIIEIAPTVQRIMYKTDDNSQLPMFDAFVESQAALAQSRRVVDMAMDSAAWRKLARPRTDAEIANFQESLQVKRQLRSQYLQVMYTDPDPAVATTAVNAVMDAYMSIVRERDSRTDSQTLRTLENRRITLNNKLADLRARVQSVTEELGVEGLEERARLAMAQLNRLDERLGELDLEIAAQQSGASGGEEPRLPTEQELAVKDPMVAQLLDQKGAAERRVAYLENYEGAGAMDPRVVEARLEVTSLDRRLAERVQTLRSSMAMTPDQRAAHMRDLVEQRSRVAELRAAADEEVKRLGKKRGQLADLEADRVLESERLDEVKNRLEQINTESAVQGRINIVAEGDRPVGPLKDKRVAMAFLGGVGGLGLGVGLVLLRALRDSRMRHIADMEVGAAKGRFLGILPEVESPDGPDDAEDPDAAERQRSAGELGDYCIHHVRTMLTLRSRDAKRAVAITSPSAGAGKTTLALALGASFAASGSRTLLIDCDLVGHGLTSALRSLVCANASRLLLEEGGPGDGVVQRHSGQVEELLSARRLTFDDAKIAELLAAAREMAADGVAGAGAAARSLEGLSRPGSRLSSGKVARRGILGALEGAPIEDCILDVGQKNLRVLPVGDARPGDAERLSHDALAHLVASCRAEYDTILIDTGPILGSLEAALVTSVADSVLLVVARGELQRVTDQALERLEEIRADVSGVVFNRATAEDVVRSSYASRSPSLAAEAV